MIRLIIGFAVGAATILALVYSGVLTPSTVRVAAHDPRQGVQRVTDNVVREVRKGVKNLRTEAEAAAMVHGKTGQKAICRREGMTNRHVCRTADGKIYRLMDDHVILFKGDIKTLDPDLKTWAKKTFTDLLPGQAVEAAGASAKAKVGADSAVE